MPTRAAATPTELGQVATAAVSVSVSGTVTVTVTAAPPPSISALNAVSVTQLAVFGPALSATVAGARLDEVAWAPTGPGKAAQVAVAGAPGVLVYDRAGGQLTQPITTSAWATTLTFSDEGRWLAAGTVNATVEVFDAAGGELRVILAGPGVRVEQVRYLPAPGSVPAAGYALISLGADNRLHFWDVALQAYLGPLDPGPGSAHSFDLSPRAAAGQQWLAVAVGSTARLWQLPALLAAAPAFNAVPAAHNLAQPAPITSLALSADGRRLAVGNSGGTLLVWDLTDKGATGPAQTLDRLAAPADRLAFSPAGDLLASAHSDRLIRVWAIGGTLHPLATLAGHTDRVTSVAFSPDGRELASAGWEGLVRVWGVAGP